MSRLIFWSFRLSQISKNGKRRIISSKPLPRVTVQIPVCNDGQVLGATLDAVVQLDYPQSKLEIQILDDSDLDLQAQVTSTVEYFSTKNCSVNLLRRKEPRVGAKAGNLNEGLKFANGEYLAVLDVDARPSPNFVRDAVHELESDQDLAMVQASWMFRNRNQNILTRIQALLYDAITEVQQSTRSQLGEPFHFHGSGALWRRAALKELGGWSENALGEDLELSMKCRLNSWKFKHVSALKVDIALVPNFMNYQIQQERWVMGQFQVLKKYGFEIFKTSLSMKDRLLILGHLSHPLVHLLLFIFLMGQLLGAFKVISLSSPFPSGFGAIVLVLSLGTFFAFVLRGAILSENPKAEVIRWYPYLVLRYPLLSMFQSIAFAKLILFKDLKFQPTPKQ